jgi:hypothetical protein
LRHSPRESLTHSATASFLRAPAHHFHPLKQQLEKNKTSRSLIAKTRTTRASPHSINQSKNTAKMSHKHDEPPAYGNNPSYPQQAYYQGGGPPPQQGAAGGYYQQQQPMGYGGHPQQQQQQGPPPPGGYYQQGPYPPQGQYHGQHQEQKSSGPGFFSACLAGLACCCCLDMLC